MAVLPKDHLNHILMYGSITKGSSLCMAVLPKMAVLLNHKCILIISLCMAVLPKDHLNHILMYGSITKGSS